MINRRSFLAGLSAPLLVQAQSSPLKLSPETIIALAGAAAEQERNAASLLQEYLRKSWSTGTGFEIRTEAEVPAKVRSVIAVGKTRWAPGKELAALHRDGFLLRRDGKSLIVAGGSPQGSFYGAAAFLDRFLGIRFYMPGDLFTVVPKRSTFSVSELNIVEEPFVKSCMMSGAGGYSGTGGSADPNPRPAEREWLSRNAALRKESLAFTHQHSMFARFPPEKFAARYPEIYPILNGKRYIPSDPHDQKWQPCLTEPKLVDAGEESALDFYRQNPQLEYLSFSIQDSHIFCQCDRCNAELAKHGGDKVQAYSDMNAAFLNRLAERLAINLPKNGIPSKKTIVYIAYSDVRAVPSFPIHKSIVPVVVFKIGDMLIDKVLDPANNLVDHWAAAVKKMGNHDWGQGSGYFIPRYYTGLTSRFFRYVKAKQLEWSYQHFEAYPNWGFDGPKLYITSKIWWNPEVDVNALWSQFTTDLFPAAAAPMYEYFQTMESLWVAMDDTAERKLKKWSNQFSLTSEQRTLVDNGRKLLGRAASLASAPEEKTRIDLFSKCYRFSEYFFDIANAPAVDSAKIEKLRSYTRDVIAADPMTHFLAPDLPQLMENVDAAIGVITKSKPVA